MNARAMIIPLVLASATAGAFDDPARPPDDPRAGFREFQARKNENLIGKFTFVRVIYDSIGGYGEAFYDYDGRRWQRWETDYPEADENFLYRVTELTTCEPNPRSITRRLTDPDIFDYPFIYMCDVGWMELSDEEEDRLREYLDRGGFLWVDDFWGQAEWDNLEIVMEDVLPGNRWRPIANDHELLTIVFKLDECPQVPARDFAMSGMKWDPPDIHRYPAGGESGVNTVNFRGYFAEDGRLLCVATHNTDIGDGWEREAEDEWYFQTYSTKSYALGVNIIVYALTH